ncbi:peptidase dimerization domain-containing protein [Sphingomonas hengshuiensis]|uniref:Amidohydrolase n=1 Tax=Sphingomonas hengshuiensis TaxID=1609977 RepID=A0A7U5CUM3_9SPHN|nr:peptidase dimerization domain-containing protein [Sphingomonas hengshuiensis]AJP70679.1 amidohydrolase [Sphingomonas hengshuiensis]
MRAVRQLITAFAALALGASGASAQAPLTAKRQAAEKVDAQAKLVQEMVDSVFSFSEPGFQEYRTMAYLTGILEKNGFTVTRGIAGIPTAWTATWGDGGPLIALGSDVDCPTGLSQYPGVPTLKPMVEGAPGHGEGHNSGVPLMIAAAIAARQVMIEKNIPGRLMLWPGVAEELLGAKAYYVRAGVFKGVDAVIFGHVGNEFATGWGDPGRPGVVSVEYTFHGKTAHAGAMPWEGLSALDGVELMDVAWNFRREHLPPAHRSHSVITNGGGQPNVVPAVASVWYYFRGQSFDGTRKLFEVGNAISQGAAMATGTTVTRQLLGYAAPNYNNKALAETLYANMKIVGMPKWSADDQAFARAVQQANDRNLLPLRSEIGALTTPDTVEFGANGSSDDIGDVMWAVPTIRFTYPANIPGLIGHNAISAMAMATPIAHKGAVAGAKVVAMTVLDLMTTPRIVAAARDFQQRVQFKDRNYDPVLTPQDNPALHLNRELMEQLRPQLEKFYYDPARYPTYLDQLGIKYPNLETDPKP